MSHLNFLFRSQNPSNDPGVVRMRVGDVRWWLQFGERELEKKKKYPPNITL